MRRLQAPETVRVALQWCHTVTRCISADGSLWMYKPTSSLGPHPYREWPAMRTLYARPVTVYIDSEEVGRPYTICQRLSLFVYRSIDKLYRTTTATDLASGPDCMGLYPPQTDVINSCSRASHGDQRPVIPELRLNPCRLAQVYSLAVASSMS